MGSTEEMLVYQKIEQVGNKGIWAQPLRKATGLDKTLFNKTIRKLESKKLIKSVTSVSVRPRFWQPHIQQLFLVALLAPWTSIMRERAGSKALNFWRTRN